MREVALLALWWLGLWLPPDRRVLERTILPHYAAREDVDAVLFVGVRPYTRGYARRFGGKGFVTIDPDPRMRFFGAREHQIARLEDLKAAPGSFDVVILNGVLGWGIGQDTADAALRICFDALRPGGELVLGVNEEVRSAVDLRAVPSLARFEPLVFAPLGAQRHYVRMPFATKSHTYLFYRRP